MRPIPQTVETVNYLSPTLNPLINSAGYFMHSALLWDIMKTPPSLVLTALKIGNPTEIITFYTVFHKAVFLKINGHERNGSFKNGLDLMECRLHFVFVTYADVAAP